MNGYANDDQAICGMDRQRCVWEPDLGELDLYTQLWNCGYDQTLGLCHRAFPKQSTSNSFCGRNNTKIMV